MRKLFARGELLTRGRENVVTEFEQFPEGIQILHQASKPAVVDIVFVHGLTGDRQRTWTHPEDSSPWPQTLLPPLISNARILTYGYDAYVIRPHGPVSSNRVRDHANHLLSQLTTHRLDASARPIIFVTHSLGGLVCKDALLVSRSSPEAHIQSIARSTFAIAFMGTPHSGSALAAWAQIPAKSLGIVKSSNATLLAVLQTSSEVLSRIQDDFLTMLRALVKEASHIQVTCFHETLPLPVLGIIVPRDSAVLSGYQSVPIRANHSNMVKFKSANDPGFVGVSGELIRWVREIENSTTSAEAKARFLQSLAFSEMGARLANVESPFDNTCEWIFGDARYMQWNDCNGSDRTGSLLWIKGKPGSGKSTLMRRIFQQRSKQQARSATTFIAFFFNARGADLEKTPEGLYRTLLHQLLKRSEPALKTYLPLYLEKESGLGKGNIRWHKGELSQLFFSLVSGPEISPLEIFVDALDECEEDEVRQVVQLFEKSAREATQNHKSLKICWSSRHYPYISLDDKLEVHMESENTSDIQIYVESKFNLADEAALTQEIRKETIRKASGVFLWAVLVIRRLLKAWDQGFRPCEIWELLIHLPSELEKLYEDILKRLDEGRKEQSLRLWQLVLHSYRPLEASELDVAMQLSSSEPTSHRFNLLPTENTYNVPFWSYDLNSKSYSKRLARYVTDLSGGLFEIVEVDEKETVQVIHESVRDFSYGSQWIQFSGLPDTATFIRESHVLLAKACINLLGLSEIIAITRQVSTSSLISRLYNQERLSLERGKSIGQTPFAEYVLAYIFDHMEWLWMNGGWQYPVDVCAKQTHLLRSWLLLYSERTWDIAAICKSNLLYQMTWFVKHELHSFDFEEGDLLRLLSCINNLWTCSYSLRGEGLEANIGEKEHLRRYYKVFWAFDKATGSQHCWDVARSITGLRKNLALERCEAVAVGQTFILQMDLDEPEPREWADHHNVGEEATISMWRITECLDDLWKHIWGDCNPNQRRNVILYDLEEPGYISLLLRDFQEPENSGFRSTERSSERQRKDEPSENKRNEGQIFAIRAKTEYSLDLPWGYPGEPGHYMQVWESYLPRIWNPVRPPHPYSREHRPRAPTIQISSDYLPILGVVATPPQYPDT